MLTDIIAFIYCISFLVLDIGVLPECVHAPEFNSTYVYTHLDPALLVYPQFKVYPRDHTWFSFYKNNNEGNSVINKKVKST